MHCENRCTWRGDEDELIEDPRQSDENKENFGTRWVCPACKTYWALVEDRDKEDEDLTI
jgi:hypothetical protein